MEAHLTREHRANITIQISNDGISDGEVFSAISFAGHKIMRVASTLRTDRVIQIHVAWWDKKPPIAIPDYIVSLGNQPGVNSVEWQPEQGSVTE
jgi:hypothetical protein